jgi:outer membrane receptor protein involved in Fe transport
MKTFFAVAALLVAPSLLFAQNEGASTTEVEDVAVQEPIVVTAEFRDRGLLDSSGSTSVIRSDQIDQRNATHLEQVLNLAPNVNFSTGASRGRFFQIRGIGERSQFVEPMNASVGLLIDGIDLTGLGGAATTVDIEQVEVLRGPQGTLFGANALAGMIHLVSGAPTEVLSGRFATRIGDFGRREAEGMLSGPLGLNSGFRIAYSNVQGDGYQENGFLGTDDNAGFDEQTLRTKFRWQPSADLQVDITGLFLDIDNGYDGFSLDNTRTTLSDEPGFDRQETRAGSVQVDWNAHPAFRVEGLLSRVDADLDYGFDEDWSFVGICDVFECVFDGYSSFDRYLRSNDNTTLDLRAVSATAPGELGWVVGAYARDQAQDLQRIYTFQTGDFFSDYDTENRALYGRLDVPLADRWTLVAGLRYEQRDADYVDSDGAAFETDEGMWGGRLALEYRTESGVLYALASRGYKAGGVNSDSAVPVDQRTFDTESMWNYELGVKTRLLDDRIDLRAALFLQDRDDVQTDQALVLPIEGSACPCEFIDYQTNAAAARSYGLELELNWRVNRSLETFASLGLLESEFVDFLNFSHVQADPETGTPFDMDGRELPQAPSYQFALGAVWQITPRWYLRGELEAKDDFLFSSRHEVGSNAYELFHLRIGYRTPRWDLAAFARNLTDETIRTRGFGSFGNDPRTGYAVTPYFQFGAPRTVGVSASYAF